MELKTLRKSTGITQTELAGIIGISQQAIQRIEAGLRKPSPKVAKRMQAHFGITLEQMWDMFYNEKRR
jgi:DNA-binding XRE family transcriptional regulator